MHPLSVAVPDSEVRRSEIVATRLARKVAPLFGVIWENNPFGCTWLCDFSALTLAEIARGAPYPPREIQSAMDGAAAQRAGLDDGAAEVAAWTRAGRAIWTLRRGPTPAAIAHATLNRYGPDTKAAVVLTGANRLLQDVTKAVANVCGYLADRQISPELRLAVWAGLVLEAYRGQPALIVAGIEARAIQRALVTPWTGQVSLLGHDDWARCEIGATAGPDPDPASIRRPAADPHQPVSFDLIDATLPLLGLPLPVEDGPLVSEVDLLDDVTSRWCRRLLQIGRPGRGIAWVAEQRGLHRTLQTYVRVGSLVAPFVAEVCTAFAIGRGGSRSPGPDQLPDLPPELHSMPPMTQRAHLLSAHTVANYVRFHDDALRHQPELRAATRDSVHAARDAAVCLGPADPVRLLLDGYAAYCDVWDSGRAPDPDHGQLRQAAARLAAGQDEIVTAWHDGQLDSGTASYLLEVGTMALGRARAVLDGMVSPGTALADRWRDVMIARGVDPDRDLSDPATLPAAQQYHLQNYAEFLAAEADTAAGLRHALALQRACLRVRGQVARGELAEYESKFTSTRTSHQAAVVIATQLLAALGPEAADEAREVLAEGLGYARAVLANPAARAMLAEPGADPELIRMALALLPLLVRAAQAGEPGMDPALFTESASLLQAATASAALLGPAVPAADRAALRALGARLRAQQAAARTASRQLAGYAG